MLDEIEALAKVLETNGLEEETTSLINVTIREQIEAYRNLLAAPPKNISDIITPDAFAEWVHGKQTEGGS